MKLKQSKVFKAGIGYTIGNVMVKGINFLAIPIFSRLLTTEEMGLYTVFAAYEAVLFVFIGMALHSSIRSAKYEFEGKIDDFTSSIMGIYWINLIVALFISIVFNKILTKLLDLDLVTLVMLVIYSFGIAVVTLYNARISLDYEYKKYIKVSLASTIGNVGLSLILIKTIFNSSRGFGRVLGITISTVLVTAANICNSIVIFAGNLIDMDIGLSMATEFNPSMNSETTVTGNFYYYVVLVLLLVSDMHTYLIRAVCDSFSVVPLGGAQFQFDNMLSTMTKYMGDMFVIGFRIFLPVFACMMIMNCILGIMAKVAPQMNMFSVGIQLKIIAGFIVLFLIVYLIPSIANFIITEIKTMVVSIIDGMY